MARIRALLSLRISSINHISRIPIGIIFISWLTGTPKFMKQLSILSLNDNIPIIDLIGDMRIIIELVHLVPDRQCVFLG